MRRMLGVEHANISCAHRVKAVYNVSNPIAYTISSCLRLSDFFPPHQIRMAAPIPHPNDMTISTMIIGRIMRYGI